MSTQETKKEKTLPKHKVVKVAQYQKTFFYDHRLKAYIPHDDKYELVDEFWHCTGCNKTFTDEKQALQHDEL